MQRAPSRARVTTPCRTTTAPTPTPIPEALATPETLKAARDAERAARHGRERRADKVVEQLHADAELLVTKGHLPIGLVHTHLIEREVEVRRLRATETQMRRRSDGRRGR